MQSDSFHVSSSDATLNEQGALGRRRIQLWGGVVVPCVLRLPCRNICLHQYESESAPLLQSETVREVAEAVDEYT